MLLVGLFSCTENNKTETTQVGPYIFNPTFKGIGTFINYQQMIDSSQELEQITSLLFTHQFGYTLTSVAFLDKNGETVKATIEKNDTDGRQTIFTYYFLKEVLSMVRIEISNPSAQKNQLEESVVFYNTEQIPINAYTRFFKPEELMQKNEVAFNLIDISKELHEQIEQNMLLINDIHNQEGQFELYFQGFDEALDKKFVQFGNQTFSTNLAFEPEENLNKLLQGNSKALKNQKFLLQHQQIIDPNGYQFQVLLAIEKK